MGILDGGLRRLFGAAFGGLYLDGTHHAGTRSPIYEGGTIIGYTGGDTPIKVQTDMVSDEERSAEGYEPGTAVLIVLAQENLVLTENSHITDGYGDKYRIGDVDRDAGRSHWICRGTPV